MLSGYASFANERLGAFDLTFECTGSNALAVQVMAFDGVSSPSGYHSVLPTGAIGPVVQVVPGGVVTKSYHAMSNKIGFFGSGNVDQTFAQMSPTYTFANVSLTLRNPSDLRGAQMDIVAEPARYGYTYGQAVNQATLTKQWGTLDPNTGVPNLTAGNYQGGV